MMKATGKTTAYLSITLLLAVIILPSSIAYAKNPTEWPYGGELDSSRMKEWSFRGPLIFKQQAHFSDVQFSEPAYFWDAQFSEMADFRNAQFSEMVSFRNAQFLSNVDFRRVQFSNKAYFRRAQFFEMADFQEAQFSSDADFRRVQFSKMVSFWKARFLEKADFQEAQFSNKAYFEKARFSNKADFLGAQFSNKTYFKSAQFFEMADFQEAQFSEIASFMYAKFSNKALFERVRFSNKAYFLDTQFSNEASFSRTQFSSSADFSTAQFSNEASFSRTQFSNGAYFLGAQFSNKADFSRTRFSNEAYFLGAQFSNKAYFRNAQFFEKADFQEAQCSSDTDFLGVQFSNEADFENAVFDTTFNIARTRFEKGVDLRRTNISKAKVLFDHRTFFPPGALKVYWSQLEGNLFFRDRSCASHKKWKSVKAKATKLDSLRQHLSDTLIAKRDSIDIELNKAKADFDSLTILLNKERYDLTEIFYHRLRDNYLSQNDQASADGVMFELASKKAAYLKEPFWGLYGLFMGWGYKPLRFVLWTLLIIVPLFAIFWHKYFYIYVVTIVDNTISNKQKQILLESPRLKPYDNRFDKYQANTFTRICHVLYFSSSVLLGIRFKKEWIIKENRAFLTLVTIEWLFGIGLYALFIAGVKSYEFGYVKGLLGF